MKTEYISTTDTAKIIRRVLKESFPDIKFHVRNGLASKIYSEYLCEYVDRIIGKEARSISLAPAQFSKTLAMYSPMNDEAIAA
jgi:hypothetical protein